jgi:hypothetical protein
MVVLFPRASEPAGMVRLAVPPLNAVAADLYVPLVSVTDPVGVDEAPATVISTCSESVAATPDLAGVTVTAGVVG